MKKKIASVVLITVIVSALAGCNAGNNTADVITESPAQVQESTGTSDSDNMPGASETEEPADGADGYEVPEAFTWDLSELFESDEACIKSAETLEKEYFPEFRKLADRVCVKKEGSDGGYVIDEAAFLELMKFNEKCLAELYRIDMYSSLKQSLDALDPAATELVGRYSGVLTEYVGVEALINECLVKAGDSETLRVMNLPAFAEFKRELEYRRDNELSHSLPADKESIAAVAQIATNGIVSSRNTLIYGNIEYDEVTLPDGSSAVITLNNSSTYTDSRDRETRKIAYESVRRTLGKYADTFAGMLNSYYAVSEENAKIHKYDSVFEQSLDAAELDESMYNALINAAAEHVDSAEKHNLFLKEAMGYDRFYMYDRNVKPGVEEDLPQKTYTLEEAGELVTKVLGVFGEDYVSNLGKAFDSRWIDASQGPNREKAAYSAMCPYASHPYLFLDYEGDYDSVSTMAHELGHTMHQNYSELNNVSSMNKSVDIMVSEICSTLNEQLLGRYMMEHAGTDAEKLEYVQRELALFRDTFYTQLAFSDLERKMHKVVEEGGTLTADMIGDMWVDIIRFYHLSEDTTEYDRYTWIYVSHFYYDYYVYKYAIAIGVSCNLAEAIQNGDSDTVEKYLEMLKKGRSKKPAELIAGLGIDITKPDYLDALFRRYDELSEMEKELCKAVSG